ncbi:unnamed protein product [Merluccius merluccius]
MISQRDSLPDVITGEQENQHLLSSSSQAPDEQTYNMYSSMFDQVIQRSSAYQKLLSAIKKEYDDIIRSSRRREEEASRSQHRLKVMRSHPVSLHLHLRQVSQLRDRLSVVQVETSHMEKELEVEARRGPGLRGSSEHVTPPPSTGRRLEEEEEEEEEEKEEKEEEEELDRWLQSLEEEREALVRCRGQGYVPWEVKVQLENKLQAVEAEKHQLIRDNTRLHLQWKRLRYTRERLERWEEKQDLPLKDLLSSIMEELLKLTVSDADYQEPGCVAFLDDDPVKIQESEVLVDFLDRGSPQLLLMQAVVTANPGGGAPGERRSEEVVTSGPGGGDSGERRSEEVVRWGLEADAMSLVVHAVAQHRLMFSELLGDVLSEHAQKHPGRADLCLALACTVFQSVHVHRKAALSMCRRGLEHAALEYMHTWRFTAEPLQRPAAILSVAQACSLLIGSDLEHLVVQLLDSLLDRGALQPLVQQEAAGGVVVWEDISSFCSREGREELAQEILCSLLSLSGTALLTSDPEGAQLMEHVLL